MRKPILFLYVNFFILIFSVSGYAVENSAVELSQRLSRIGTLQADFIETITDNLKKSVQPQSTGRFLLKRPNQFRWEVKQPIAQSIISDGKRLWIYDPDLEQVSIKLLSKQATEAGDIPALLLSNSDHQLEKQFHISALLFQDKKAIQWFILKPKKSDSFIAFIKIGFVNNELREIDLQDHLGHNTVIEFYNIKSNINISDKTFYFKPPAKVDVIDETL